MANKTYQAGRIIFERGMDVVRSLDIITKGRVRACFDYCTLELAPGSVIGIGELPNAMYTFTYEALEDTVVYSYPYTGEADLVAMFKTNQKLIGTLVVGSIRFASALQKASLDTLELAGVEYSRLQEARKEYPDLAVKAGMHPKNFPELDRIPSPELQDRSRGWHRDFIDDLAAYENTVKKDFLAIPSIGLGIGLMVNNFAEETMRYVEDIFNYLDNLKETSAAFMNTYQAAKTPRADASDDASVPDDPTVHDPLTAVLDYGMPDSETAEYFRSFLSRFKKSPDKYGSEDNDRLIRRELTKKFYDIYTACFLHSVLGSWDLVPLGVRMFLLFGYIDEELAGPEYAAKLASLASSFVPGREAHVLTVYEWLTMIYEGKVMPSKNEFDLDYPAYLKEQKRNGEISEMQEHEMLDSRIDRLKFEIKNMFSTGNRVTFGRITTFVPVFDKDNVNRTLDQSYVTAAAVEDTLNKIRSIDFRAFCRQSVFSNPEIGINSFFLDAEVLPYVILMPNIGSRASLWQEIDSKKRTTPARMILSIFHTEDLTDTCTRLVAEFRWEMCKTEQGVHWNDITDPSLTSMYCDYLQFYRKNSALSAEMREKIGITLKNNSNNFKKIFVADYLTYMKYESQGALRLNKVAREILFAFCPFAASTREKISDNPQFAACIKTYEIALEKKIKPIKNLIAKLNASGIDVPAPIQQQADFLER